MKRAADKPLGHLKTRIIAADGLAISLLLWFCVPPTHADLLVFKATKDGEVYANSPQSFDTVVESSNAKVYVERKPVMAIHLNEIESVEIEEREVLSAPEDLEDFVRKFLGETSGKSKTRKDQGKRDVYYQVTFFLNKEGERKLNEFGRTYRDGLFDIRLNDRRIGIPVLAGPLDGKSFTLGLRKKRGEIEAILSPVKEKLSWK